jgi:hypothetical protein
MRTVVGDYEIDDDPARIDPAAAVSFLTTEAYWAGGAASGRSGGRSPRPPEWSALTTRTAP